MTPAKGSNTLWLTVLSGLSKFPDPDIFEHCYFQQLKGFRPMSEDIAHYNREEEGSKDRSYEFLCDAVDRHLKRTRQQKMREALSRGLLGNQASPSAPAPGKGTEGKGKDRQRSRSADAGNGAQGMSLFFPHTHAGVAETEKTAAYSTQESPERTEAPKEEAPRAEDPKEEA